MAIYVALLRAVNVGGKNKLPMAALTAMCEAHGCTDVRTYIQSGNVVFRASSKIAARFPAALQTQIKEQFHFETAIILRSADDLRAVTTNNPYLKPGVDTRFLHVIFLAAEPDLTDVVKLNPPCLNGDAFSLRGREIFLHLPNGAGRSKMAVYPFDKVLRTSCSMRNWRTVTTLLELAS